MERKVKVNIHIIEERCRGCGFCIEFCPRNVLERSEEYTSRGYHPPKVVRIEDCAMCRLCERICPDFAIFLEIYEED